MTWIVLWIGINFVVGYFLGRPDNSIAAALLSVFLGPIGWIIALMLWRESSRKCPFCAEEIKADAKVCRFCGRDLPAEEKWYQQRNPGSTTKSSRT